MLKGSAADACLSDGFVLESSVSSRAFLLRGASLADKKTGEIIEDTGAKKASAPATGQGAAATGAAEAKTGATGATKTGEKTGKEKSKCCGLCVIQ